MNPNSDKVPTQKMPPQELEEAFFVLVLFLEKVNGNSFMFERCQTNNDASK